MPSYIVYRFLLTLVNLAGFGFIAFANLGRLERYRQSFMPFVAIGYLGLGLLGSAIVMPLLVNALQGWSFLGIADQQLLGLLVFDAAFLALFALMKYVALRLPAVRDTLVMPIHTNEDWFYVYDDDLDAYVLRSGCAMLRGHSRTMALVGALIALAITIMFGGALGVHPCFVPLILVEVASYLGGQTKEERNDSFSSDDSTARTAFSYAKLERVLRYYFGDRLLVSKSKGGRRVSYVGNTDLCESLIASSDPVDRLCGAYYAAALEKGLIGPKGDNQGRYDDLVHDLVKDTGRLLKGQSVLFASPFFGDYVPYVFLPINTTLLHGSHVLILMGAPGMKKHILDYIDEGISFVTNVPNMWQVGELARDGASSPDVALLSSSDLDDIELLVANRSYLESVGMCVVIDPSSILVTYQIGLAQLAECMAAKEVPTYCVFDRNEDGLVDSLSHILRTSLVEVSATGQSEGISLGMHWAVDGLQLQNRLMPGVARYLGVGTELALVALHEQVSRVTWVGKDRVPLQDVRWIDGQYYPEMFDFAELPQEQAEVDEHLEFVDEPWTLSRTERRFMVVEDDYNNMFETYRQFSTRGTAETFVNVLAPNYLMREYMARNADVFLSDPKAVPTLAPDISKAPRNAAYSILMTMLQTGESMEEEHIAARLRYAGVRFNEVGEALTALMVDYFSGASDEPPESHLICDEQEVFDPELGAITTKRFYSLSSSVQAQRAFEGLKTVPLTTEMPDGTKKVVGSRMYDLVYQSWLPGQFVTLEGKYYEVVSIAPEMGVLLRRAADHFMSRHYYRQIRTYHIRPSEGAEHLEAGRTLACVMATMEYAHIDVDTLGYLDMADFGDVAHAKRVITPGIARRSYENKRLLKLELQGATPEVTRTIALVMSELFVTLFPKDHQYLAVLSMSCLDLPEGLMPRLASKEESNVILIVEDSPTDVGLVSAVNRNLQRILELCFELLDWHESELDGMLYSGSSIEIGQLPDDAGDARLEPPEGHRGGFVTDMIGRMRDLLSRGGNVENHALIDGSSRDEG